MAISAVCRPGRLPGSVVATLMMVAVVAVSFLPMSAVAGPLPFDMSFLAGKPMFLPDEATALAWNSNCTESCGYDFEVLTGMWFQAPYDMNFEGLRPPSEMSLSEDEEWAALAYKSSDCLFQTETEVFLTFGFSDPSAGPVGVCPFTEDFSQAIYYCAAGGGETFLVKGGECVGVIYVPQSGGDVEAPLASLTESGSPSVGLFGTELIQLRRLDLDISYGEGDFLDGLIAVTNDTAAVGRLEVFANPAFDLWCGSNCSIDDAVATGDYSVANLPTGYSFRAPGDMVLSKVGLPPFNTTINPINLLIVFSSNGIDFVDPVTVFDGVAVVTSNLIDLFCMGDPYCEEEFSQFFGQFYGDSSAEPTAFDGLPLFIPDDTLVGVFVSWQDPETLVTHSVVRNEANATLAFPGFKQAVLNGCLIGNADIDCNGVGIGAITLVFDAAPIATPTFNSTDVDILPDDDAWSFSGIRFEPERQGLITFLSYGINLLEFARFRFVIKRDDVFLSEVEHAVRAGCDPNADAGCNPIGYIDYPFISVEPGHNYTVGISGGGEEGQNVDLGFTPLTFLDSFPTVSQEWVSAFDVFTNGPSFGTFPNTTGPTQFGLLNFQVVAMYAPDAVTNVATIGASTSGFTVTWTPVVYEWDVDGYTVEIYLTADACYDDDVLPAFAFDVNDGTASLFPVTGLTGDTTYYVVMTANNMFGTSLLSTPPASVTTVNGAADGIAFDLLPVGSVAGQTIAAVQVTVMSGGAPYLGGGYLTLDPAGGCATLSGTLNRTVSENSGRATFSDLVATAAGPCTLEAHFEGLVVPSPPVTISPGPATVLSFETEPDDGTSLVDLSPAPVVALYDAFGNAATNADGTVTVTVTSGPLGGSLVGTGAVSISGGTATFDAIAFDVATTNGGQDYVLTATTDAGSANPIASASFEIAAGPPSAVVFTTQPSGGAAASIWAKQPVIRLEDQVGNLVAGSGASVSVALNAGIGPLNGNVGPLSLDTGTASFANLGLDTAQADASLITVTTGVSVTEAVSGDFDITVGAPAGLVPNLASTTTTGGVPLDPFTVTVVDAGGNTVDVAGTVTLMLVGGPTAGSITAGASASANNGVATFAATTFDLASGGTPYSVMASAQAGTLAAMLPDIAVTVGPEAQIVWQTQPGGGPVGVAWGVQPEVAVTDAGGNVVVSAVGSVTVAQETGPGSVTGTLSAPVTDGVAAFADLEADTIGTYTLMASYGLLGDVESAPLSVGVGAADHVRFVVQPSDIDGGEVFGTALAVEVVDVSGVRVTATVETVTLSVESGPGTLDGTVVRATVNGLATFGGLSIDQAGTYTVEASVPGIGSNVSVSFTVNVGAPVVAVFALSPSDGTGGSVLATQPVVLLEDAGGNVVDGAYSVTLVKVSGPGTVTTAGASLTGGAATFSDVSLDIAGTYSVRTEVTPGAGITNAVAPITITVGAAAALTVDAGPTSGTGGSVLAPAFAVTVRDAGGNAVTSSTDTIVLSAPGSPGVAGGVTSVSAEDGVAMFGGVVCNEVGDWTFEAVVSGVPAINGAYGPTVTVSDGPAVIANVDPATLTVDVGEAFDVTASLFDAGGNAAVGSTEQIRLTLSGSAVAVDGPSGLTPPSSGVATFTGVSVATKGDYTLKARNAGNTLGGATMALTVRGAPGAVDNLAVVSTSGGEVGLQWDAPADNGGLAVDSYLVEWEGIFPAVALDSMTVSATEATVTGVGFGSSVRVRVSATNAIGTGPASGWEEAVTAAAAPSVVTGLAQSAASPQTMTVRWNVPASNGGSILFYSVVLSSSPSMVPVVLSVPTVSPSASPSSLLAGGLSASTDYYVTITATNSFGTSPVSGVLAVATAEPVPDVVPCTAVPDVRSMELIWSPPAQTVTQYDLYVATDGGFVNSTAIVVPGSMETGTTVTDLLPDTPYFIRLAARNQVGLGPSYTTATRTEAGPPGSLQNLTVTEVTATSFTLAWVPPELNGGVLRAYIVTVTQTSEGGNGARRMLLDVGDEVVYDDVSFRDTEFTVDEGLEGGVSYRVEMVAESDIGVSPEAAVIEVTTQPAEATDVDEVEDDGGFPVVPVVIVAALLVLCLVGLAIFLACRSRGKGGKFNYATDGEDATVNIDLSMEDAARMRLTQLLNGPGAVQIGAGATAEVWKCKMPAGDWVAVKRCTVETPAGTEEFHNEAHILSKLAAEPHKNIIGLRLFCHSPPAIVLELADKGSLQSILKSGAVKALNRLGYMQQVAEGVCFLHLNDIAHLDIKPLNILVDRNGVCKLTDFGSAVEVEPLELTTVDDFYGTPKYAAPERFVVGAEIDLIAADVFSLGLTLWQIWTRRTPFDGVAMEDVVARLRAVAANPLADLSSEFDLSNTVGKDDKFVLEGLARERIMACISVDPSQRTKALFLVSALGVDDAPYVALDARHGRYHLHRATSTSARNRTNTTDETMSEDDLTRKFLFQNGPPTNADSFGSTMASFNPVFGAGGSVSDLGTMDLPPPPTDLDSSGPSSALNTMDSLHSGPPPMPSVGALPPPPPPTDLDSLPPPMASLASVDARSDLDSISGPVSIGAVPPPIALKSFKAPTKDDDHGSDYL